MESVYQPADAMRGRVGMVVPAWFGTEVAPAEAERLLNTTLAGIPAALDPQDVVVVVDGSPVAAEAARALHRALESAWGVPFTL